MAKKKTSKVILGLDVSSSSTGYAVLVNGRFYNTDKYRGKIVVSNKIPLADRLVLFRDELFRVFKETSPTEIIIEDVFSGRNIATMKLLARFSGVALEASSRFLGKTPIIALATTVRAGLGCGKGKDEAFDFIRTKYKLDWDFDKMNDVSDAIALALYLNQQEIPKEQSNNSRKKAK